MKTLTLSTVFLSAITLSGWSNSARSSTLPNISLIRSYTFALEAEKQLDAPYVAKYERDGKVLLYVASKHLSIQQYPNLLDHPTLKTVSQLFADYKPDVVVVEGIDTGSELSPKSILKKADECEKTAYQGCGESFFAINQARKIGSAYITGEPTNTQIRDEIVNEGFTTNDLLGFYIVRQIPQMKRQAEFDAANFPAQADKQLHRFQEQLGIEPKFGFKEFDSWYSKHMSKPKSVLEISNSDPAPHGGEDATYVQRISNKVCLIRDRSIVKTIQRMLGQFDRVLVLYGGSHLITQEPAIESMMGKGTYFRIDATAKKSAK